jgi:hypothetical protein
MLWVLKNSITGGAEMYKSRNDASIDISSFQKNTDDVCGEDEYWRYGTIPGAKSESISYETPRFKRYGNCSHVKVLRTFQGGSYNGHNDDPHGGHTFSTSDRRIWANNLQAWVNGKPAFQVDVKSLCAEAYSNMKPSLDCGFSLSNFLIELAEFKWIYHAFKKAKKSYDFVNKVRKTKLGRSFDALEAVVGVDTSRKNAVQNMGGAYLMYQFGWKLFVKDLMELYTQLANMEKTLHDYASRQNIPQVRHFKKSLYTGETGGENYSSFRRSYRYDCDFFATMKYTYRVGGLQSEYAKLKGILDIIGLKANLSVLWNAIPFSFVVDWFLNVGDSLESVFNKDYLESNVTILDFCYSVKSKLIEEAWLSGPNYPEGYLGNVETTTYNRRRAVPNTSGFGLRENDRFGGKQILLSTALLVA